MSPSSAPPTSARSGRTLPGLLWLVLMICAGGVTCGLLWGSQGFTVSWQEDASIILNIRAPRTLGALLAGALLGLGGALAQGLFRNPLADPYLLGSAAGAGLGVVAALASGSLAAWLHWMAPAQASAYAGVGGANTWAPALTLLQNSGLVIAAFFGALFGVGLTLVLAGGAARPLRLLLAGVVVGVILGGITDLLMLLSPEALRGRQSFLMGSTSLLAWENDIVMGLALAIILPLAWACGRVLDALVLGDATAATLGLDLARARLLLVALMALSTAAAVSQAGLVAFIGLLAPHVARRWVAMTHRNLILFSCASGAGLLVWADVAARWVVAPQEVPVGLLSAVLGGIYLLLLLRQEKTTP